MIVANLASYPPRRDRLEAVVASIAPQVGRVNLVLNEYAGPLQELEKFGNVNQIIPTEDTKDVGKFYPDVSDADFVLMIDDDLVYPSDYVERTVARFTQLGDEPFCAGYHASLYEKPRFSLIPRKLKKYLAYDAARIADFRKVFVFYKEQPQAVIVDQVATNAAIMRGKDFPPYSYMAGSQKFVDVRLAKWCFEKGITPIALPKTANWFERIDYDETIYEGFTKQNPPHVSEEIMTYAFKVIGRGQKINSVSEPAR